MLCGLADKRGEFLGLGILKDIDYQHRTVQLLSRIAKHRIKVLQFGDMYLEPEGKELKHGVGHRTGIANSP